MSLSRVYAKAAVWICERQHRMLLREGCVRDKAMDMVFVLLMMLTVKGNG